MSLEKKFKRSYLDNLWASLFCNREAFYDEKDLTMKEEYKKNMEFYRECIREEYDNGATYPKD